MDTHSHWHQVPADSAYSRVYRLSHSLSKKYEPIQVRVANEGFALPFDDERLCFANESGDYWVREILIESNTIPLSYGRVVAPHCTFIQHQQALTTLGNRPIGETYLHHDAQVHRSEFEYCALAPEHPMLHSIQRYTALTTLPKWGRRSVFDWHGVPLLISEVILIAIEEELAP